MKPWILSLVSSSVNYFPWSDRLISFSSKCVPEIQCQSGFRSQFMHSYEFSFLLDIRCTFVCRGNVLCVLPISSHRILKRCTLEWRCKKNWDFFSCFTEDILERNWPAGFLLHCACLVVKTAEVLGSVQSLPWPVLRGRQVYSPLLLHHHWKCSHRERGTQCLRMIVK